MGVFSEMDCELREQAELQAQNTVNSFTLGENVDASATPAAVETFDDDAKQQAEADSAQAALSILNGDDSASETEAAVEANSETTEESEDQKKKEHEAQEAQRKAEWEEKQAEKKAAFDKALKELLAMSDDDVANASVKRANDDLERLTRRNMKMCVTEVIQTKCLDDPAFARMVYHPKKSLINCFKYINRKAQDFVKQELEMNGEKAIGAIVEDVPDDLCYQWAIDYFNDPDAEEDMEKEEKFVPKPYYGKSSSKKKKEPAKKEPAKKKEPQKPAEQPAPAEQMQLMMGA